jgi:hypothetical protein
VCRIVLGPWLRPPLGWHYDEGCKVKVGGVRSRRKHMPSLDVEAARATTTCGAFARCMQGQEALHRAGR